MCGRFTRQYSWREVHDFLALTFPSAEEMRPSYNVAPTQATPVCLLNDGARALAPMTWGFTPAWSRDGKPAPINARSETAAGSRMFRKAFAERRCVVPASGFFERRKLGDHKQPYYIRLLNDLVCAFAGLWERWAGPDGPLDTFAILTTAPNQLMAEIHDRMPVILDAGAVEMWLHEPDPSPLFTPYPVELMEAHPVSTRVNSPRNDDPSLIEPRAGESLFG